MFEFEELLADVVEYEFMEVVVELDSLDEDSLSLEELLFWMLLLDSDFEVLLIFLLDVFVELLELELLLELLELESLLELLELEQAASVSVNTIVAHRVNIFFIVKPLLSITPVPNYTVGE